MRLSRGDLNNKSFPIKKKYLKVMPEPEYIFLAKQDSGPSADQSF